MKIYVASSWRNEYFDTVVKALEGVGHTVYNFRNPEHAFDWADLDPNWENWEFSDYVKYRKDDRAVDGFLNDTKALRECDALVLVLPCGNSSHLELGFAVGQKKRTFVLWAEDTRPDLMYGMCTAICETLPVLIGAIGMDEKTPFITPLATAVHDDPEGFENAVKERTSV